MEATFNSIYYSFSLKMEKHSITVMRIALALVYIWFGALKIFGMSPAGELVEETVYWFRPEIFVPILGICEVLIGLGLLIKKCIPYTILLLLLHMCATLFPVFILQNVCFDTFPYCPTKCSANCWSACCCRKIQYCRIKKYPESIISYFKNE